MTESAHDARNRAEEYREKKQDGGPDEPAAPRRPRSEAEWRDVVSQAIEDAMRQGEFDNLRGRGKPLNLERDPFTPEGSELAYDIMKNNDVAPAWLAARKEALAEIDRWRERLAATASRCAAEQAQASSTQAREEAQKRWQAQRETFRTELERINRRIRDVNLQQPVVTMEIFMLRLGEELLRAGATFLEQEGQ